MLTRLVLFDIDGTLLHSGGAGSKAFARAFAAEFGLTHGAEKMKFAGRTDVSLVREFFTMHGVETSPANFDRFFKAYLGCLAQTIREYDGGACAGVMEFYHALKLLPEPPLIGLLTGNIRDGARIKLGHYNLWEHFTFGGFADDHEDRDQIAAAAKRKAEKILGRELAGREIIVIGDTPADIRCARAIKAKALAVATGSFEVAQLAEHAPDWAVEDLSRLVAHEVTGRAASMAVRPARSAHSA